LNAFRRSARAAGHDRMSFGRDIFSSLAARITRTPKIALAIVGIVVLGLGGWLLWGGGNGDQRPTTTQKVVIGDVEDTVTAVGKLQPLQFVDVGTQVSGQLKKLHVTYGDAVEQGQLLAEIDPTIYQARVNAGEAQLLNLQAQLAQRQAERTLAEQQFGRQTALLAERATSQDAFDASSSTKKVNAAQINALQAQIKQAGSTLNVDRANLSYTKIYAPMSGMVVDVIAKQGQTLNANQTAPIVLRIADMDTMTVYAQVSEADVPKLKVGMTAYFTTLGQAGRKRYGKLRKIIPTPEVVNNVVLYNALFDVENPDKDLFTQMSAQVFFLIGEARSVPIVPITALRAVRGGEKSAKSARAYVVRVKDGMSTVDRPVEVGVMNRLVAEIKVGLNAGDDVLIDAPSAAPREAPRDGGRGPRI
jgi:membrane fusion protein, macrolide-specific efflux system